MKFIVGEYGGMDQSSSLASMGTDGLKSAQGQADIAVCNCSIQSLEFPASKNAMLEVAFSLLKVGGELRVTDLVCSRRLSSSECEEARFAMETSAGADGPATVGGVTKQFEQKLLLSAPYIGDLQRLYRSLSSDIDVRRSSCNEVDAMAIDVAVGALLPTLAAGGVHYRRVTFRAFRLQDVEDPCENYGQTAILKGVDASTDKAENLSRCYRLDDDWRFQKGVSTRVDGNTAQILRTSWLRHLFSVSGDRSRHRGPFARSPRSVENEAPSTIQSSGTTTPTSEPLEMVDI
ncbi:hypothetical protein PHYSODRAFT_561424 [Phytophthora sojae]|uniref:Uncharacterized protein n=1 Tax=Phytophthora sojae (strain P6497) TaxID=1094619 RepID=G4ZNA1_PHYSP|nr:hypothetical protein PHYSODRAFT_561420 [Phytophthora sojae]XP_009529460.1 hypothetical protein PHYSODRAFT_561424 [Phytophthora sojae]EGZ15706.1 hypothetical protein PHYSODRAFT_561420 [Phytophthora sojae]EGZ15711.1 hypothetical protein PHYSODRAFT_561424 [Phytophthora sojae]|eukprot:XP_009529455.1 hypothetical protein PHYSODRAFT_561420 [Phytophthora sojae]